MKLEITCYNSADFGWDLYIEIEKMAESVCGEPSNDPLEQATKRNAKRAAESVTPTGPLI